MPMYEYACKSCGEHLEVVQSFKDDALTECPGCGGLLRKVFGAIGIAFKGSGFYRNDNRVGPSKAEKAESKSERSETKTDAKGETKSDAKAGAKTGAKTETKPDAKPEAKSA